MQTNLIGVEAIVILFTKDDDEDAAAPDDDDDDVNDVFEECGSKTR